MHNPEELKIFIKLKYLPIEHSYEYLIKLPDSVIDQMFFHIGTKPERIVLDNFKETFINEYVVYNRLTKSVHEPAIEKIILITLFKHYSENMHSIEE